MKTINLLLTLILLIFISPNLQSQDCGTIPTQQQIDYLIQTRTARQSWSQSESITSLPIQHHIVRESNGTGGLNPSDITLIMNTLNTYYANSNIGFYECATVNYIDNSTYYDFNQSQEAAIRAANDVTDVINIYYFNSITMNSGNGAAGYSSFPPGPDRIMMDYNYATNGSTMVHEAGHYFHLPHTHGNSNTTTTTELVNGTNCRTAGD